MIILKSIQEKTLEVSIRKALVETVRAQLKLFDPNYYDSEDRLDRFSWEVIRSAEHLDLTDAWEVTVYALLCHKYGLNLKNCDVDFVLEILHKEMETFSGFRIEVILMLIESAEHEPKE